MTTSRSTFWSNEVRRKDFLAAMGFLAPNILGFLVFVACPVLFSAVMAFTNWNLTNLEPFRFSGLDNFRELLFEDEKFWRYFVNTLYFLLGMPISIAGSLLMATLLSNPLHLGSRKTHWAIALLALAVSFVGAAVLWQQGRYDLAFLILILALIVFGGLVFQAVFFRTLFYLPCFTSGVAMFILWKNLLHPDWGLINQTIGGIYGGLQAVARLVPPAAMHLLAAILWLAAGLLLLVLIKRSIFRLRSIGYLPQGFAPALTGGILLAGLGWLVWHWPHLAAVPFEPVHWLASVNNLLGLTPEHVRLDRAFWGLGARDAIIMMGVWTGIGGNNMLLYLAGLANIPQDLYEAAEIDGAGRWARFRHITWPQLAPTTFFIVIMSTIGGLQGGFEQAYVMTKGGPAGTTTTLGYYIYTIGFEEFRLGYASTVAWVMFAMIFMLTLFNWKFGSRLVND